MPNISIDKPPKTYEIDHLGALNRLRDRLIILQASPHPEDRGEEIANVQSVIATYERLYPPPRFNLIDCTPRGM